MNKGENIYGRLERKQQAATQRVLIWYVTPAAMLLCLVALLTGNGNPKFFFALGLGAVVLLAAVAMDWRKRRARKDR